MSAAPALRVAGLTRKFNGRPVVDGVDLTIERGEIMGFLGPNGAGKTTFMKLVMGLLRPHDGSIELLGVSGGASNRDVRLRVGYLQEQPCIYPEMSARHYLEFFARLYGVPDAATRIPRILDRVGLGAAADRVLGSFSRGMQQRACLARVMLHTPEFLILDEPTLGLDPEGVAEMREILMEMRAAGATLFFSSHQLAEMERLCERVAFMKNGKLLAVGSRDELLPTLGSAGTFTVETFEPIGPAVSAIRGLAGISAVREIDRHQAAITLVAGMTGDTREARAMLVRELHGLGLTVLSAGASTPSLEELFLTLAQTSGAKN